MRTSRPHLFSAQPSSGNPTKPLFLFLGILRFHPCFRKVPKDSFSLQNTFGKFRETHTTRSVLSESSERLIQPVEYFRKVPRDLYNLQSTFGKFRETYTTRRVLSENSERPIQRAEYFRKVPRDSYNVQSTFGTFRKHYQILIYSLANKKLRHGRRLEAFGELSEHDGTLFGCFDEPCKHGDDRLGDFDRTFGIKQKEVTPFRRHL